MFPVHAQQIRKTSIENSALKKRTWDAHPANQRTEAHAILLEWKLPAQARITHANPKRLVREAIRLLHTIGARLVERLEARTLRAENIKCPYRELRRIASKNRRRNFSKYEKTFEFFLLFTWLQHSGRMHSPRMLKALCKIFSPGKRWKWRIP